MRRVIIESPYSSGTVRPIPEVIERNVRYLRACLRDCVLRGETPYASHGLLTQDGVLRDDVPEERAIGIDACFAMRRVMDASVIYTDLGWSSGMRAGKVDAELLMLERNRSALFVPANHPIEERQLGGEWVVCSCNVIAGPGPHHEYRCPMWRVQ